jgi:hypothetical protein
MKKIYLLTGLVALLTLFSSCTKQILDPNQYDPNEWMRTHERGVVAYVDYFSGNYIVETFRGFTVVENWNGTIPREFDQVYANWSFRGNQVVYNRNANYFTNVRIVDSWLSWQEALFLLDRISLP